MRFSNDPIEEYHQSSTRLDVWFDKIALTMNSQYTTRDFYRLGWFDHVSVGNHPTALWTEYNVFEKWNCGNEEEDSHRWDHHAIKWL